MARVTRTVLACLLVLLALPAVASAGHCDAEPWPWEESGYQAPPPSQDPPAQSSSSSSAPPAASGEPAAREEASAAPADHSHADHQHAPPAAEPAPAPTALGSVPAPLIRTALAEPWACTPHRGAPLKPCPRGIAVKLALSRGAQVTGLLLRRSGGRLHRAGTIDLGKVKPGAWTLRFRMTADGQRLRAGQYRVKLRLRDGAQSVERSLDLRLR